MKQVKWAISTEAFEKHGFPRIEDALKRNNIEYFQSAFELIRTKKIYKL